MALSYRLLLFSFFFSSVLFSQNVSVDRCKASYYANFFHGRTTSNGEIFDQYKLTAAHKSLPFGSLVKVTNLENLESVIVRINDRGPFVKKRCIDLSKEAAKELGMLHDGVVMVVLECLYIPKKEM